MNGKAVLHYAEYKIKKRDLYLNRMIAFQDKEMIRDHERSGDKGA